MDRRQIADGLRAGLARAKNHPSEFQYQYIEPRILAEQLLENTPEMQEYSQGVVDYKIWCFNGEPLCVFTATNRTKTSVELALYDLDWQPMPQYVNWHGHNVRPQRWLPRPENLERMLEVARTLSADFPFVRVDLYSVGRKVYFGELTFTSAGGIMDYFTNDYLRIMGSLVDMDRVRAQKNFSSHLK